MVGTNSIAAPRGGTSSRYRGKRAASASDGTDDGCLRCCIAWILRKRGRDVPHFVKRNPGRWTKPMTRWLAARGLLVMRTDSEGAVPLRTYTIAIGPARKRSRTKNWHAVVMRDGAVVYDSNPKGMPIRARAFFVIARGLPR